MINCIIVDDEPKAIAVLEMHIRKIDYLNLRGSYTNAIEALKFIEEEHVNLIFLDINMPDLSGIEFINSMSVKPKIIFTTAYSEYAVESYDVNAVDYLLKPILFPRFLRAVHRAKMMLEFKEKMKSDPESEGGNKDGSATIFLKSGSSIHQIELDDICYVEGARNYLFVYTKEGRIMTLMRMKELEDQLPPGEFIRVHKSYIVALKHIKSVEKHQIRILDRQIPVGRNYREMFLRELSKK